MTEQPKAILHPLVTTEGEKHAEFRRRRDDRIFTKVPAGGEPPLLEEGWQPFKRLKKFVRLAKDKSVDRKFEDKVWQLFYRMGYDDINKGQSFTITYKASDKSNREKQVDIFAKDEETVIVGECKACEVYKNRSLSLQISEFISLRKPLADAIRRHYGKDFKPKILWFFFTDKVLWSPADKAKAESEHFHIMTEREIDYFTQLSQHLGRATRYQFLAEYLGGQKIPEMKNMKVPAIRGKLGGKKFYSFVSTADQLLKICFVNHRTLADPLALPTYQRLVNKNRLKSIGEYIKGGGFFPTNILINFEEKRQFDRKDAESSADIQFGDLHLPEKYKSAWIIDGQHRLYGYSVIDPEFSTQNIAVIAFEGLRREEEADLFVTINHEQKTVPRTLLDELDADLKWGSSKPSERLSAMAARIVQMLSESVGGPLFRRVVAQGMKADDVMSLTMPEIKGGVMRSHLLGSLALKRKVLMPGPLAAESDEQTVKRASQAINGFLQLIRQANPARWDLGRQGNITTNVGIRGYLLLFAALIDHLENNSKLDSKKTTPTTLVDSVAMEMAPLLQFVQKAGDADFSERFGRKFYGSGGPIEYFYELTQIIYSSNPEFNPEGLQEYMDSKDETKLKDAHDIMRFIEIRATEIIIDYFKKVHGEKYWNYIGTKDMRVKSYQRQQEVEPDQQLDVEAYLDFIDKKKIVEKSDVWPYFQKYFSIPPRGEKGHGKNLQWMDRINELRKVVAHSHKKRTFTAEDLIFLGWIKEEFEKKLLAAPEGEDSLAAE